MLLCLMHVFRFCDVGYVLILQSEMLMRFYFQFCFTEKQIYRPARDAYRHALHALNKSIILQYTKILEAICI